MIFDTTPGNFESEKERNLYYKFFAGCFFNELIPDYGIRLAEFYSLLAHPTYSTGQLPLNRMQSPPSSVSVSFDNHADRYLGNQSGEFADVLIQDSENSLIVGIEAKYLDDWTYDKDIVANFEKLEFARDKLEVDSALLCLLLAGSKWENVVAMEAHPGSNYRKLAEHTGTVAVLLWESLVQLRGIPDPVQAYVRAQLNHERLRPSRE